MRIRTFKDVDAMQTSKLIRKSMLETNRMHYPMSVLKPLHDYFTPTKIKQLASERYFLVVEEKGLIIGTGSLEDNQLLTIFVHPKHQSKGIGSRIVQRLEKKAIKESLTLLEVSSSITGSGFYKNIGYKEIRNVQSKHAGKQILMRKKL